MVKKSRTQQKLISIVLIVVSAGLAIWGYQKSGGFQSQLSSALTGSHTDAVMGLYIGAAVCITVGIFLYLKKL